MSLASPAWDSGTNTSAGPPVGGSGPLAGAPRDPMPMRLACSSESHNDLLTAGHFGLEEWLRFCADELGLTGVELEDKHIGEPTGERLGALRDASARHGLEIVNIALMNNFG